MRRTLIVMIVAAALLPASAASAASWSVVPSPAPPGVANGAMNGVACMSASACVAVGSYETQTSYDNVQGSGFSTPLAERFNGSSWSIVPTPDPSPSAGAALQAVSCGAPSFCMAVGFSTNSLGHQVVLAERWNGSSWSAVTAPTPAGAVTISDTAVSCVSSTACQAVGTDTAASSSSPFAEEWNGSHWTLETVSGGAGGSLASVACTSATACTAVGGQSSGDALAERFNGSGWSVQSAPGLALAGVACPGPQECFAVSGGGPKADRWNGSSWTAQTIPGPADGNAGNLSGIACASTAACTAVGYTDEGDGTVTFADRWNGTSWSLEPAAEPARAGFGGALTAVSCPTATACRAVGEDDYVAEDSFDDTPRSLTLAEVGHGTGLALVSSPNPVGPVASGLKGVACSAAGACMAVGGSARVANQIAAALAERWNGESWGIQSPASGIGFNLLAGVSCPGTTRCEAAGYRASRYISQSARLSGWDGTSWTSQTPGSGSGAIQVGLGISCSAVNACTAVGYNGGLGSPLNAAIERWNGAGWSLQRAPGPPPEGTELDAVSCPTATACDAVGALEPGNGTSSALAERWNGSSWSVISVPQPGADATLTGVSCTSASSCEAAGEYRPGSGTATTAFAAHFNGTAWSLQTVPSPSGATTASLAGVSCSAANACEAVGSFVNASAVQRALAEHFDGAHWTVQATPQAAGAHGAALNGVSCTTGSDCTAVGQSSLVPATLTVPLVLNYR
jgi:hypothetical protein